MGVLSLFWNIAVLCIFLLIGVNAQSGPLAPASKESAPNPIADTYPNGITGTFNSTLFVVPIPYKLARSLIPKEWNINKKAYRELLPGFPKDSYPLVIRSGVDHDVGLKAIDFKVDDFQTVHTFFPFVDLFNDGYSSYTYNKYLLITETNLLGIGALPEYGTTPVPATFSPNLEAYGYSGDASCPGERYFNAYSALEPPPKPTVAIKFKDIGIVAPWHMNFYINTTNQPIMTDGKLCDNQIFFYNTSLSNGFNAPRGVRGSVTLSAPLLPEDTSFNDVFGVRVDTAFLEIPSVPCAELQGYHGTGPGDRGTAGSKSARTGLDLGYMLSK
ncbi:hypothetical protein BKA64DRAFT_295493 [Cadophora sp. MPI-SDFR-AT-0126]|nr:hypothetical protein BKA64DRAFT_295493 [Leotiomycetes sp. MPI-SDFR-AT-0126]